MAGFLANRFPDAFVGTSTDASENTIENIENISSEEQKYQHAEPIKVSAEIDLPTLDDAVAIIGMSGSFAMAPDLDAFWQNLAAGRDCVTEIPADRWNWRDYWSDTAEADRTNIRWGAFMSGVDCFDPLFFSISPAEAELMDPQQRLLMMHVWNALENAGHAPQSLAGSRTGIFAALANLELSLIHI